VHLDGLRERHDASVDYAGTFDEAVEAIRESQRRGFRVTINTTFFNTGAPQTVREVLDFLNDDLRVDQTMISPRLRLLEGARPGALPGRRADLAAVPPGLRRWPPQALAAQPLAAVPGLPGGQGRLRRHHLGIPSYSVFGWQRPCYLMSDSYASTTRPGPRVGPPGAG
jgi:hypothetical protein